MSLMKEEGLSCLQEVVGGVQTHLSFVGGVYPSFYLARNREKKTSQMFIKDFGNVYALPSSFNHQFVLIPFNQG